MGRLMDIDSWIELSLAKDVLVGEAIIRTRDREVNRIEPEGYR